METIFNSIGIICLTIAYILHLVYLHKPIKFEITKEDLERHNKLQEFLEKANKTGEDFKQKTENILTNVPASSRDTESKSRD